MLKKSKYVIFAILLSFVSQATSVQALTMSEIVGSGQVLGDATMYPYPSASLVTDGGTIYFISGTTKVPFTSWKAFVGLGYSSKYVIKGSLVNYNLASSYTINTANAAHPWGSWLTYKNTIYYSSEGGLIGVPSTKVFQSNGGKSFYIVKANKYDLAILNAHSLPVLTEGDSRVILADSSKVNSPVVAPVNPAANLNSSALLVTQNYSFVPSSIVFGSVSQHIASYILTAPTSQAVKLASVSITAQPNNPGGASNFVNMSAKVNGTAFGPVVSAVSSNSGVSFTGTDTVLIPQNSSVTVDIYADIPSAVSGSITSLNPGTNFSGCDGTGVNDSAAIKCNSAYGQNLTFITNAFTSSSAVVTSLLNGDFTGGSVTSGSLVNKIGSYKFTASQTQGASLNSITIEAQPSGGQSVLQNLFVKVNGTAFGQVQSTVFAGTNYTFSVANPFGISINSTSVVDVYADITSSAMATSLSAATVLIGCTGFGSLNSGAVNCNTVNGQNLDIRAAVLSNAAFPIATALNSAFASSALLFGSYNQQIGSFVLTGTSTQAVNIGSISIQIQPTGGITAFQNLLIRVNNGQFSQPVSYITSAGIYAFNGSLNLGVNGSATVDVYGDILQSSSGAANSFTPATKLFGCTGYALTNLAPVSCPAISGQAITLSTSTPQ